jgi:hypothetical protein
VTSIDALYAQTLQVGFLVLRQAFESGIRDWVDAELELLHNVPSLIGETNTARHRYFWCKERKRYMDWASAPGRDQAKSRMMTYYLPIWEEMEPLMNQLLALSSDEQSSSLAGYGTSSARTGLGPQPKRRKRGRVGN